MNKRATLLSLTILFQMFSLCFAQSVDTRTDSGVMPRITRENIPYFVETEERDLVRTGVYHYSPKADLKKYPGFKYNVKIDRVVPIEISQKVPDEILDLPLRIVNDPIGRDSTTIRELAKNKMLVLDFWGVYCGPCLESMDKWKDLQPKYEKQIQTVGLMLDYDYKSELVTKERGWNTPQIVGAEAYFLNAYFCGKVIAGPSSWIDDQGLFLGNTDTRIDTEQFIPLILSDKVKTVPDSLKPNLE